MQIVTQTKIAFGGYALLLGAQLIFAFQNPSLAKKYLINMVGFALVAALGLYVINCSVVGHCDLYAWIVGYLIGAIGVVAVVMLLFKNMISSRF